ncbi:BgTH12-06211 [Blumeria graminis f. sp. triticale]|uniref:BgTH12-06211 n=1 Tax=Blumeria graminis f. sp. triticale TaxID=1689686 RepID=A0A9W4D9Q4_BLUGR|nr:BgTH12-06211 [Blumeria graminis f. sp. triticale]
MGLDTTNIQFKDLFRLSINNLMKEPVVKIGLNISRIIWKFIQRGSNINDGIRPHNDGILTVQ